MDEQLPKLLTQYLSDSDDLCPRCGYNLRGLTGSTCPECGSELKLTVGLVEPRMGAYLSLLAAWSIGLGGSGLFLLLVLFHAPSDWIAEHFAGKILVAMFFASVAGVGGAVRGKTWLRKQTDAQQRRIAIFSWLTVVVLGIVVLACFND